MAFDLHAMALCLGGPEQRLFMWASEELNAFCQGREPGIPSGWGSMYTEAKLPGVQAASEKTAGAMAAALLGVRTLDGGGELKGVFSPEQLIIDCEIRDHVARLVAGVEVDCDAEACLVEVAAGLGRSFVGLDSTLDGYMETYWFPRLFDRRPLSSWQQTPEPGLRRRAREVARKRIREHDYALPSDAAGELARIYDRARKELSA
jgi:trimethylamine:corrinoid methyltransferase-like protein